MKCFLAVLVLTSIVLAGGSSVGNLRNPRSGRDIEAMGSGYYDTRNLTIGDDTTVVSTAYSGLMCISIKNETDADMTIKYYTESQDTTTKTMVLPAYCHSGLLPSIHTIIGTAAGATGGLVTLYFWNIKN